MKKKSVILRKQMRVYKRVKKSFAERLDMMDSLFVYINNRFPEINWIEFENKHIKKSV